MPLPDQLITVFEAFAKLPQKKIARATTVLLIVYIAYLSAQLTWLLVPQANTLLAHQGVNKTSVRKSSFQFDIAKLQKLNLFGQYQTESVAQVVEVKDAPETRLNLTLSGVVASNKPSDGAAIIENSGKQETYGIGDVITGTRATLEQVMSDRVLIKQSGRLETLMLDGFKYQKLASSQIRKTHQASRTKLIQKTNSASPRQQIDQRKNKSLQTKMAQLKKDLTNNPSKITDYLNISPRRQGRKLLGYRLSPGKDKAFFNASGLKSGDVAIQMNGFDLSEPAQAAQALKALREDNEVSLTIDRHGEIMEILFSINK